LVLVTGGRGAYVVNPLGLPQAGKAREAEQADPAKVHAIIVIVGVSSCRLGFRGIAGWRRGRLAESRHSGGGKKCSCEQGGPN
jgi:hypothetical protein